ncbi:hypothetical protein T4D_10442 [Trichinella pseudospiralis]|uniref:Uncharacterized protein n=1 Tax=Trichinella pseudospiralis TaxID=6337 RepID=A0A0V1FEP5_TRIPS|nr:hypothetical protein T4D_10442 [Trichinella pseudospiralis]
MPSLKHEAERKGKAPANTGSSPNSDGRANSLAEETDEPARGSGWLQAFSAATAVPIFRSRQASPLTCLLLSFSFKKVSAQVRVVNTSLRNSRHSLRAASRDSPSGSTSSSATGARCASADCASKACRAFLTADSEESTSS